MGFFFFKSCDHLVFFCVPLTLFWLLVFMKDHHLEVFIICLILVVKNTWPFKGKAVCDIIDHKAKWGSSSPPPPMEVSERYLTASIHLLRCCLNNMSAWIWAAALGVRGAARCCFRMKSQTWEFWEADLLTDSISKQPAHNKLKQSNFIAKSLHEDSNRKKLGTRM